MLQYTTGSIADVPALMRLGLASYGVFHDVLTPDNWSIFKRNLENEAIYIELINKATCFICKDGDTIAGMIYLLPNGNPTDIYPTEWCYIRMLGVHPHYMGKGIARKLIERCLLQAQEWNEHTIALHTSEFMDAARHLYESFGFSILKEIAPRFGKKYWLYTLALTEK